MDEAKIRQELGPLIADGIDINEILEKVENPDKIKRTNKQYIRFFFFFILSFSTYGFFVRNLFWKQQLITSGVLFCFLFIELIFLSIDMRGFKKRKMRGFLIFLGLILQFFLPTPNWQVSVALWMSLITIGYLLFFLRSYFKNVRKINWLTYFTRAGYIFTLMTTITFGFSILGTHTKFPFQCDQISSINEKLIKNSTSGLLFGNTEEKTIFDFKKDIEEIQGVQTSEISDEDSFLINELRTDFKSNMMDGFLETKDSINNKVCEAVISQIDQIYQNPVFQIGVIFGIYLLFYGVIRFLVRIITIIGYIFFTITRWCGLYGIKRTHEIVEEVV